MLYVGLDPMLLYIQEYVRSVNYQKNRKTFDAAAEAICVYNFDLIDAFCDIVPAVNSRSLLIMKE